MFAHFQIAYVNQNSFHPQVRPSPGGRKSHHNLIQLLTPHCITPCRQCDGVHDTFSLYLRGVQASRDTCFLLHSCGNVLAISYAIGSIIFYNVILQQLLPSWMLHASPTQSQSLSLMPCCITLPRTNAIQPQPPYLLGVHCKFTLASTASESLTPSYRPPSSTPPFNCLAKSSVILPINSLAVVGHHKSSIVSRLNGPAHS